MGALGNRGKCAQACRLPYELVVNSNKEICMDKGYLLSTKDLCGLKYLPDLIRIGVSSLKIEGRMKTPEYVATVTRIYRKYIDLAYSNKEFIINEQDQKDLLQVFNRGGSSSRTP
ncbi:MAG: U32 family peptidase [Clostridia bacterium]|nr:U32 family peptidase [Clostridia bacterium]